MANDYRNFFEDQRRYYDQKDKEQSKQKNQQEPVKNTNFEENTKNIEESKQFNDTVDIKKSAQTFKNLADYYNNKGEDKLIADIFSSVKAQKAAGTLTDAQIVQFAKSVTPMLNKDQKEKMSGLLKQLLDA